MYIACCAALHVVWRYVVCCIIGTAATFGLGIDKVDDACRLVRRVARAEEHRPMLRPSDKSQRANRLADEPGQPSPGRGERGLSGRTAESAAAEAHLAEELQQWCDAQLGT